MILSYNEHLKIFVKNDLYQVKNRYFILNLDVDKFSISLRERANVRAVLYRNIDS